MCVRVSLSKCQHVEDEGRLRLEFSLEGIEGFRQLSHWLLAKQQAGKVG